MQRSCEVLRSCEFLSRIRCTEILWGSLYWDSVCQGSVGICQLLPPLCLGTLSILACVTCETCVSYSLASATSSPGCLLFEPSPALSLSAALLFWATSSLSQLLSELHLLLRHVFCHCALRNLAHAFHKSSAQTAVPETLLPSSHLLHSVGLFYMGQKPKMGNSFCLLDSR